MSFFNFVLISIYIIAIIVLFIQVVKVDQPSISAFFIHYIPLLVVFIAMLGLVIRWNMYKPLALIDIGFIILFIYGFTFTHFI